MAKGTAHGGRGGRGNANAAQIAGAIFPSLSKLPSFARVPLRENQLLKIWPK
jgi:hypothetical protein